MQNNRFFKQAELLLQTLPFLKKEKIFALKGGTAVNFFFRNSPGLSVDIALTYPLIKDHEKSLSGYD